MQHATNGYALTLNTTVNPISIAKVLEENFEYWTNVARKAIFKEFNREGDAGALAGDVWFVLSSNEKQANTKAFAPTVEEAEKILGRQIRMYAKNTRYVPGITELAKIKTAHKNTDVTICSFSAVADTIEDNLDKLNVSIEAVYVKDFATKWDKMCDDGQLTFKQILNLIKQLAIPFKTGTAEERLALIQTVQDLTDLGPDSSDELKEALYAAVKTEFGI